MWQLLKGFSLVAHSSKVLLTIIFRRLTEYCEQEGTLSDKRCDF